MHPFILDGNTLELSAYTEFDRPNNTQVVRLLGDGVRRGIEALQQGILPYRQATLQGRTTDNDIVDALRALYESKAPVTFEDCDGANWTVEVLAFAAQHGTVGRRTYSMTLVEVP